MSENRHCLTLDSAPSSVVSQSPRTIDVVRFVVKSLGRLAVCHSVNSF